jgi:hypothetical protein
MLIQLLVTRDSHTITDPPWLIRLGPLSDNHIITGGVELRSTTTMTNSTHEAQTAIPINSDSGEIIISFTTTIAIL